MKHEKMFMETNGVTSVIDNDGIGCPLYNSVCTAKENLSKITSYTELITCFLHNSEDLDRETVIEIVTDAIDSIVSNCIQAGSEVRQILEELEGDD